MDSALESSTRMKLSLPKLNISIPFFLNKLVTDSCLISSNRYFRAAFDDAGRVVSSHRSSVIGMGSRTEATHHLMTTSGNHVVSFQQAPVLFRSLAQPHCLLVLLLLLSLAIEAQAQQNRLLPTDDWAYATITRRQRRGHLLELNPIPLLHRFEDTVQKSRQFFT